MENLARRKLRKISTIEKNEFIEISLKLIKDLVEPRMIYLFGSAMTDRFDAASDLDFLLVFDDTESVKKGQKVLYRNTINFPCAVDFVCFDQLTFSKKSEIGGVAFIAKREGELLFEACTEFKQ